MTKIKQYLAMFMSCVMMVGLLIPCAVFAESKIIGPVTRDPWGIKLAGDGNIVTPHLPIYNPYCLDQPLRIWIICYYSGACEAKELAQRLEMDYHITVIKEPHWKDNGERNGSLGIDSETAKKIRAGEEHDIDWCLKQSWDCIVIVRVYWNMIRPDQARAIMDLVKKGTGLVNAHPFGRQVPWSQESLYKAMGVSGDQAVPFMKPLLPDDPRSPLSGAPCRVALGLPYELFPPAADWAWNVTDFKTRDSKVNGVSGGTYGPYGKGRVALLFYPGNGHVIPAGHSSHVTDFPYWEYYYAFVARSVLWAGQKFSSVALKATTAPSGAESAKAVPTLRINIIQESKDKPYDLKRCRVETVVVDRKGREKRRESREITPAQVSGSEPLMFSFESLGAGTYIANCWLKRGERVIAWTSAVIDISPRIVCQVNLEETVFKATGKVGGTVKIKAMPNISLPGHLQMEISLWDSEGRLLEKQERLIAAAASAETDQAFSFSLAKCLFPYGFVRARILGGKEILSESEADFPVVLDRAGDAQRFTVGIWEDIADHYLTVERVRRLRGLGFDAISGLDGRDKEVLRVVAKGGLAIIPDNIFMTSAKLAQTLRTNFTANAEYQNLLKIAQSNLVEKMPVFAKFGPMGYSLTDEYPQRLTELELEPAGRIIRQADPEAKIGCSGIGIPWQGDTKPGIVDMPAWCATMQFIEPYLGDDADLLVWSAFLPRQSIVQPYYLYYSDYECEIWYRFLPWSTLFNGGTGMAFFGPASDPPYAFVKPDLEMARKTTVLAPELKELKAGIDRLILTAERAGRVGILFPRSESRTVRWGVVWRECMMGVVQALKDSGEVPRFIAPVDIVAGKLNSMGIRLLYLPYVNALSEAEVGAISRFVEGGGALLADGLAGFADKGPVLDKVFGISRTTPSYSWKEERAFTNKVAVYQMSEVNVRFEGNDLPSLFTDGQVVLAQTGEKGVQLAEGKARASMQIEGQAEPAFIVNHFGKGKAIFFNFAIPWQEKYATWSPDTKPVLARRRPEFAALGRAVLKECSLFPLVEVWGADKKELPCCETFIWKKGAGWYVGILQDHRVIPYRKNQPEPAATWWAPYWERPKEFIRQAMTVRMPASGHLYDVRGGKYLGTGQTLKGEITPGIAKLYAVLPYQVTGISVDLQREYRQGEAVQVKGGLQVKGGMAGEHVIHCEVINPAGQSVSYYARNVSSRGSAFDLVVPLSMNEEIGRWKLILTDVATSTAITKAFDIIGTKTASATEAGINLLSPPSFRIGTFEGVEGVAKGFESAAPVLYSYGCEHIYLHVPGTKDPLKDMGNWLDIGTKNRITVIPIINAYNGVLADIPREKSQWPIRGVGEEGFSQRFYNGEIAYAWGDNYPSADPFTPEARKRMRKYAESAVREFSKHPGLEFLCLDDEYSFVYDYQGRGRACYSPAIRQYFKEKTGLEAPEMKYHLPGYIAKDNEPYILWTKYVVGSPDYNEPLLTFHAKDLAQLIKSIANVKIDTFPGAYGGELDLATLELYQFLCKSPDLASAVQIDECYSLLEDKRKTIHAGIGWYQSEKEYPAWIGNQLRLAARISLAKGAKMITILPGQLFKNDRLKEEFIRLSQILKAYGPLFLNLERMRMPVAVLSSSTTIDYQHCLDWEKARELAKEKKYFETPWKHIQCLEVAYPALWKAQIPVELITEKDILAGHLSNYQALVLIDFEYTQASILKKIEEYSKKGGLVFADRSSAIRPPFALDLEIDSSLCHQMIQKGLRPMFTKSPEQTEEVYQRHEKVISDFIPAIQKGLLPRVSREVLLDSTDVVWTRLGNGATTYLFLLNSDKRNPHTVTVSFTTQLQVRIYDIFEKKPVKPAQGKNGIEFKAECGPADWKVYLLVNKEIGKPNLTVQRHAKTAEFEIRTPIQGAFPLQVNIFSKDGEKVLSTSVATVNGVVRGFFPLEKAGAREGATLEVVDLITGEIQKRSF